MKNETAEIRICPRCEHRYIGHPSLSRVDNMTCICPDCGAREALAALGVDETEREEIIRIMNRHRH